MSDYIYGLIKNSKNYFDKSAQLKSLFFSAWNKDQSDKMERFEDFFIELANTTIQYETSLDRVRTICLYVICQLSGILIGDGINECELNTVLMTEYYRIDNSSSIDEMLKNLKETCYKIIDIRERYKQVNKLSKPVRLCMSYIKDHIEDKLTLDSICKNVNYSTFYLSHLFVKEMNCSINDYVHFCKIEYAKQLLDQGGSIKDISYQLGYGSVSYFIQCFKKQTGITPKKFQNWAEHQ